MFSETQQQLPTKTICQFLRFEYVKEIGFFSADSEINSP